MHIRITFSSSYYKYIYSSDILKYLDRTFKEEQKYINFKIKNFKKLVLIFILFAKSMMPKRLTKDAKRHHAQTHAFIK